LRTGFRWLLAGVFAVLALSLRAHAQLTTPEQPPVPAQASIFDASRLYSPSTLSAKWLVYAGDDPAYARPDFDDSKWTPFDPSTELTKLFGSTRPQIVWYRLRVKVDPAQKDLALDEWNICHALEIYVNGQRLITVGSVSPFRSYTYQAHVHARVPEQFIASGALVVAIRVHLTPTEWSSGFYPGYYVTNLTLGSESALYSGDWLAVIADNWMLWINSFLYLALGIVALVLFSAQRTQKEYLWITVIGALQVVEAPLLLIPAILNIPVYWLLWIAIMRVFSPWLWGSLYFSFVHVKIGWRWRTYFLFAGIMNGLGEFVNIFFPALGQYQLYTNLPFIILLAGIIPVMLIHRWRKGNREAGILLIPALLFSLYIYGLITAGTLFQFQAWKPVSTKLIQALNSIPMGPINLNIGTLSDTLSIIALGIIILLRSTRMSRRQAQLEAELEAAQQVQQVLVPEKTVAVPGFAVDAVYLPAQQVGGDFFQVLPAGHGGLLVVVGDVAGKGLPAAMLVSALVGSIRTAADDTHSPDALLHRLNERLAGRTQGGFATALAAYIAPNGVMTIANAGHLSPYLDGREVELPGALPLGITSPIRYETLTLQLPPGSHLTFYSDGVIEAQNPKGELFGFDRSREVSMQPAGAIAQAAQDFGQQDDITVVTIVREQVAVSAA
jgi:sigma-B regulation protein RsbU (phosphoserine phosphatase)